MPAHRLPESCSRLTPLYRGDFFAVEDWCCAGDDTQREEWSSEDRVVVTRRGVWELEEAGQSRRADPATATLWNRGTPFRVRHPVPGGDHCTVFRLTGKGADELLEAGPDGAAKGGRTFAHGSRPIDGPAYLSHRRTLQRARQGNPDPLAVEESGLTFLRLMANDRSREAGRQSGDRRYVNRARDIIARDFRRPLRLSSIAHAAGCSPFHLSRLFRSMTGMSLYRAVLVLRLREAFERLLDDDSTLSNIALEVGFASHSHLTDAFRAEYGCPPSEARAYISSIGRTSLSPSKLGQ